MKVAARPPGLEDCLPLSRAFIFLTWHEESYDTVGFASVTVIRCSRLEIKQARLVPDTKTQDGDHFAFPSDAAVGKTDRELRDLWGGGFESGIESEKKQGRVDMGNAARLLPKPNRVLFFILHVLHCTSTVCIVKAYRACCVALRCSISGAPP